MRGGPPYANGIRGEQRTRTLADGSTVALKRALENRIALHPHGARHRVLEGQALLRSRRDKDADLPVERRLQVRAGGTAFGFSYRQDRGPPVST